jgi:hypothetical protein
MKRLFWLAMLFPVLTFSQVQKCTIEGKTVYSDSLCGQHGVTVNTDVNSLDMSGLRDQADQQRQREAAEQAKVAASSKGKPRGALAECDAMKSAGVVPTAAEADRRLSCIRKASKGR